MRSGRGTFGSPRTFTSRSTLALTFVGAALAGIAFVAAPLPVSSTSPFSPAPAIADDACTPGVMARIAGPPPVLEAIDAVPGRLPVTGAGVTVAVVDSGVDASRPQLADAIAPGSVSLVVDGERPDGLGDPMGHGTAIAGIIAARPTPGSGVTGIAPDANIISIRVLRDQDQQSKDAGFGPEAGRMADGIRLSADLGAKIIAVALSDDADSQALRDATAYASERGALVVASAGNRATTTNTEDSPRYPAAYPEALSVTAVTLEGLPTQDSIHGEHVEVAAPAQEVLTTATGAGDCVYSADAPAASFAVGYVAGAAALLAEAYPDEGPEGWAYRLQASADRPNPDQRDDKIGWGVIRPAAALDLRPDRSTRGPLSPFAGNGNSAISVQPVRVQPGAAEASESNAITAVAVGLGGIVLVLALAAGLRRRRSE
ncbi:MULTISPECIES: S8 family serine peptidase [unclassified Leucobacter]|uniref:S8 family serine peptidase n=1 Tax=unclassified Leucobacter TaxID=2621730 RepID=UPI00165DE047|nr:MULTISPECIES: S8 family serine peptidase [unclassified Leucobacter]MBC9936557.1 S8 family serine peptidase [Leucobacter sp. cx-87]